MNVNAILDDCFEDRIRLGFGMLCDAMASGDLEGGIQRFKNDVAEATKARDIAYSLLKPPPLANVTFVSTPIFSPPKG